MPHRTHVALGERLCLPTPHGRRLPTTTQRYYGLLQNLEALFALHVDRIESATIENFYDDLLAAGRQAVVAIRPHSRGQRGRSIDLGQADTASKGGGSTWTTYTLDTRDGSLYVPVGNPAPDFSNRYRPGRNLYSDSIVVLDVTTGRLKWYHQFVSNDSHDWDVGAPALATTKAGKRLPTHTRSFGRHRFPNVRTCHNRDPLTAIFCHHFGHNPLLPILAIRLILVRSADVQAQPEARNFGATKCGGTLAP